MSDSFDIELVIHVGYPKTATSWMQSHVYTKAEGFCHLGNGLKMSEWGIHLVAAHELEFSPELVRNGVTDYCRSRGFNKAIMSWEHLLGDSAYHADGLTRLANRLKQCFPKARIILYVREQLALLKAIYAQYVQEGGTWTLDDFTQLKYPYRVGFSPAYLNYELVYRLYSELFGEGNMYLQAYEVLKAHPEEEISRLFAWLGVPSHTIHDIRFYEQVNASLSRQSLSVLRVLNHIVPSRFNSLGSAKFTKQPKSRFYLRKWLQQHVDPKLIRKVFTATELQLSPSVQAELEPYYKKSNSTLAKEHGVALLEYGYLLEA